MKGFWQLYKKDLESIWLTVTLFTIAIVAWDLYLYTKMQRWPNDLAFGLSVLPLGFIFLWTIGESIQAYRHEWQTGGIYTMLSLPQPGWKLALSKLAAVMTGFTLQSVVTFLGSWTLFWAAVSTQEGISAFGIPADMLAGSGLSGWLAGLTFETWVAYWFAGLGIIVVSQAAYVISKLASRFQFLMLLAGFVVSQWLLARTGALGYYLFGWLPDIAISFPKEVINMGHGMGEGMVVPLPPQELSVFLNSGPVMGWLLGLVILFLGTAYLLQNVTEV